MFGHDNHDDNATLGAPLPPEPMPDGTLGSPAPVVDAPAPTPSPVPNDTSDFGLSSTPPPSDPVLAQDDLLEIKQQALQQLTPLVNHLDQTPEEKFRTTMMMIQASDNQSMLKTAYAAAQEIPDEKSRAQALLDIVNEINYFTHHPEQ